mgnify:CR=1 FL=1
MDRALLRGICGDWRESVGKQGRRSWGYAGTGALWVPAWWAGASVALWTGDSFEFGAARGWTGTAGGGGGWLVGSGGRALGQGGSRLGGYPGGARRPQG